MFGFNYFGDVIYKTSFIYSGNTVQLIYEKNDSEVSRLVKICGE